MMRALVEAPGVEAPESGVAESAEINPTDLERRLEDWLVSYLDDEDPPEQAADWRDLLEAGSLIKRDSPSRRGPRRKLRRRLWTRVSIVRRHSISLVRLLDQFLIKEDVIVAVAEELRDVERAGAGRIVLDFSNVERMSSQIVGVIGEVHRRCASRHGGQLKLCGLRASLIEVFALSGLSETLSFHADEVAAFSSPWPASDWARPLPVSILAALPGSARRLPTEATAGDDTADPATSEVPMPAADGGGPSVRLVIEVGSRKGNVVPVRGDRFLIGRDERCHLRCASAQVSRIHAAIERRGGSVVIRDLGTINGTAVNEVLLREAERMLLDGDRITIGSLVFTVQIQAEREVRDLIDDLVISWLAEDLPPDGEASDGMQTVEFEARVLFDAGEEELEDFRLRYAVVQDVLIVIPLVERLDEDASVDLLRRGLFELSQRPLPRRVVLDMNLVSHLSSRGVGMLLAHFLRLDRLGGSLRLCRLNDRLLSLLEGIRLPMLLETYAGIDEAVLTAWS
jgi:anti-anti-sigma factor